MALNDALTLNGVTRAGRALAGPNPSLIAVDDNGIVQRTRDGSTTTMSLPGLNVGSIAAGIGMGPPNVLYPLGATSIPSGSMLNVAGSTTLTASSFGTPGCSFVFVAAPTSNSSTNHHAINTTLILQPPSPITFASTAISLEGNTRIASPCNTTNLIAGIRGQVILLAGSSTTHATLEGGRFVGTLLASDTVAPLTTISVLSGVVALPLQLPGAGGAAGSSLTIPFAAAYRALGLPTNSSAATLSVSTVVGYDVPNMGAAYATNAYGIRLADQTLAATLKIGVWFNSNVAGASSGISWGTTPDTHLYRGAANQLATPGDISARHFLCSSTPTILAGAGAGTGPTISIDGTDHSFKVELTTGTVPPTGVIFTVTWGASWTGPQTPQPTFSPGNNNSAALSGTSSPFILGVSAGSMQFNSGSAALAATTFYRWHFNINR